MSEQTNDLNEALRTVDELLERLEKAERPVLVKVKDFVVKNRRKFVLGTVAVTTLAAAAYVATHKEELALDLDEAITDVAETAHEALTAE